MPARPIPPRPILHSVDLDGGALLALHASRPERYPALFESAAAGRPLGRYDILFAHPQERLTLHASGSLTGPASVGSQGRFLQALETWRAAACAARVGDADVALDADLPFTGGWLLYLGYELAGQIEPRLRLPQPRRGPVAQAVRVPAAVIREHESGRSWIVAESGEQELVASIAADIAATQAQNAPSEWSSPLLLDGAIEEDAPGRYLQAVERALDHIRAGDVYQANLSREWRARLRPGVEPWRVYERLRRTNPGPFSGIAALGDFLVLSSSPERLVEVRDRRVATRPIAGTRPRGSDLETDRSLARELYGHPKERAEHVMLIDLERNDLGRVCQPGSVRVDEFMTIESYAHVHHIVSNVSGVLRPEATTADVLAAVFPGGTITGCPKVRCMEIIAELEGRARGAYTGSLGYLNLDGGLDMNILIRSIEICGCDLSLRAGAGVVADSDPQRELAETRAKARGVLQALGAGALA
ncbi:MAG TPA: aminodeoxychorismate synthase component I [Steroidobacter sp.]|jgi:anthranilate synthase component 1|nr:aminodeoxychorismate synthase component I [Steroidobacteraceae bacterium]HLS81807.1 aminodeoxychorismate synthase component I [Steroidobacter sp.]